MGIPGLWKVVECAADRRSLTQHVVENGIASDTRQQASRSEVYVLGIDASLWLVSSQNAVLHSHAQAGESPELKVLFHRLARLAALPLMAVFVFDGPARPSIKRGTHVIMNEHYLATSFREFIRAFGFKCHTAPGEAEAELAFMNCTNIIDAVVTDDSDALVFGARTVIRNSNLHRDGDLVDIYNIDSLANHSAVQLSPAGAMLIAVLVGGDYDPRGLPGCGIATAHALARYGLGEALLAAVGGCEAAQSAALTEWRSTLRQLLEDDPKGYLGRRFKKLAASVPQSFPSSAVVNLYTHPITSGSADSPDVELGNTRSLPLPSVRLCELARLCEHRFTWGTRTGILKKFEKAVWPAATVRALLQDIARFESREEVEVEQQLRYEYTIQEPVNKRDAKNSVRAVVLKLTPLICAISESLRGLRQEKGSPDEVAAALTKGTTVVRVPSALVLMLRSTVGGSADAGPVNASDEGTSQSTTSVQRKRRELTDSNKRDKQKLRPQPKRRRTRGLSLSPQPPNDLQMPNPGSDEHPARDDGLLVRASSVDLTRASPLHVPHVIIGQTFDLTGM